MPYGANSILSPEFSPEELTQRYFWALSRNQCPPQSLRWPRLPQDRAEMPHDLTLQDPPLEEDQVIKHTGGKGEMLLWFCSPFPSRWNFPISGIDNNGENVCFFRENSSGNSEAGCSHWFRSSPRLWHLKLPLPIPKHLHHPPGSGSERGWVPLSGYLTWRKQFPELGEEASTPTGSPKGKTGRTSELNQPLFLHMRLRVPPTTGPRSQSNHVPMGTHEFALLAHWTAWNLPSHHDVLNWTPDTCHILQGDLLTLQVS